MRNQPGIGSGGVRVADRRKASSSATVGGPCSAVTARGTFCTHRSVAIGRDGYGYCKRHI
jgi:hypothetical protein